LYPSHGLDRLADGGAHVAIFCNAGCTTEMPGDLVRERAMLSLQLAAKRITSEPADFFGLPAVDRSSRTGRRPRNLRPQDRGLQQRAA
jgi:N-acyl-D-aspartate/D-glutamate deacylase